MPPVGFEPTNSAGERPQTYALDRSATGTGSTVECRITKYMMDIRESCALLGIYAASSGKKLQFSATSRQKSKIAHG